MTQLGKKIFSHSIIYGLGDIIRKCLGFLLIPIYTHILSPADYGVLELLDLLSYVISLLLAMGVSESVLRFYFDYKDQNERDQVITNAFLVLIVAATLGLLIFLPFVTQLSNLVFEKSDYARLISIVVLTIVIELFNELSLTLIRIQERSILFTAVSLSKVTLSLGMNILFLVYYRMGIEGVLLSGLIASLATASFVLCVSWEKVKFSYSWPILRKMLIYGAPLIFNWFSMFILNFGDRFFLQRFSGLDSLGLYSLAYKFGMLPQLLVYAPFMRYWSVKRFEMIGDKDANKAYSDVFTFFCLIEIYVSLGIAILIPDVIALLSDPEFHHAADFVPLLLLAYIFNGIYGQVCIGILIAKRTKLLAVFSLLVAALNLALNFFLIPIMNIWGATLATFISFFVLSLLVYFSSQRLFYVNYNWKRLITCFLLAFFLFFIAHSIDIDSIFLSITVKFLIAASFPFVLFFLSFYKKEELELVRSTLKRWRSFISKRQL